MIDSRRQPDSGMRAADPHNSTRDDTRSAGTVFAIMVGALMLAALLNAGPMLRRAETHELGRDRDLALAIWQPLEDAASAVGLTGPRTGLEALRDMDRTGSSTKFIAADGVDTRVGGDGDLALPPLLDEDDRVAGPTVQLGHEPASTGTTSDDDPEGLPEAEQAGPTTDAVEPTVDSGSVSSLVVAPTPLGIPGLPPLDEVRRDAEPSFALRRPTAEDPLRILIIGDSTLDAVGTSMQRDLATTGLTVSVLDFRVSSGLSRPDFFDWPVHLGVLGSELDPEIVVVMLGANDAQPFAVDSQVVDFGTEAWFVHYRARVSAVLDQLTADDDWVVWIGQPVMRNPEFDAKMRQLNQLYAEEVGRYPTARFVDSRAVTTDEAGQYSAYLVDGNGDQQSIRQADGVHLTPAGGDRLSPVVIDAINEIAPLY